MRPKITPHPSHTVDSSRIDSGAIVEYENNGEPILAAALQEKKGKWVLLNDRGREIELTPDRLYLYPGKVKIGLESSNEKQQYLASLSKKADQEAENLDLNQLWELVQGEQQEYSIKSLTELLFSNDTLEKRLVTRRALIIDKVYFKRTKFGFEPRSPEIVEELRIKLAEEQAQAKLRYELVQALIARIKGDSATIPEMVSILESLAASGISGKEGKLAAEIVEQIASEVHLNLPQRIEDQAFEILVAAKHFTKHENLSLIRYQRSPRFTSAVENAVSELKTKSQPNRAKVKAFSVTIDAETTRDIDDALTIQAGAEQTTVGIHIADVSALIEQDSPLFNEALKRATSVYCPDIHVPMLPRSLSEDALSLVQGQSRPVMSFYVSFDAAGAIIDRQINLELIEVTQRLTYDFADKIIYGEEQASPELTETLTTLWQLSEKLYERRIAQGAFDFDPKELQPTLDESGRVVLESQSTDSPSKSLVSEFMILTNETAALYAEEKALPFLFRSQEKPDTPLSQWGLDIPEGPAREFQRKTLLKRSTVTTQALPHAGLGLKAYTQLTSPIRRFLDLIGQTQLRNLIEKSDPLYSPNDLMTFIERATPALDEANSIQRESNRYWLLQYLRQERIREIQATVVRTDGVRPLAELDQICTIIPFEPVDFVRGKPSSKKLGEVVTLVFEDINPRKDILRTKEKKI
ncbi:RNB domain-containing ribonuclease [bacterium]|nr:RNB domain-containing ribonuclease [bacterium]